MDLVRLARIHAHLCGDGMICTYKSSEPDHRNRADIVYFNSNPQLINEFREDMRALFGVQMTWIPKRIRVGVKSLRIARYLLTLSQYHSRRWSIPPLFLDASRRVKIAWTTAFANDEGYVPRDRSWIRIKSVNHTGLMQVRSMLDSLQIDSRITGPNCDRTWYLNISKEKEFQHFNKVHCRK